MVRERSWPPLKRLSEISAPDFGQELAVAGWIEDIRNLGGISFVIVRQREGTLQLTCVKKRNEALFEQLTSLPRESVIAAKGIIQANPQVRNGWEILTEEIRVLSRAEAPLPLGVVDKVGAELDTRLDNRFMDLRKPQIRTIFQLRSILLEGIRKSMEAHGFVEVSTPKLISAGAEGGATLFPVDYFKKEAYLAQSPQLYKQMLMATGLDRVYEIAPAFRAELSDTVRHVAEFSSYDGEMAFIENQEDVLKVLETATVDALNHMRQKGNHLLKLLGVDIKVPKTPVPHIQYTEAIAMLREEGKMIREGEDIDTEGEKVLGRIMGERGLDLYYIIEYPSEIKPFYIMEKDGDPKYSCSFDLDYKGDEIASGGQREHRYDRLLKRMGEKGLSPESFEFYLKAFGFGMPPHGGWGLGIDRLLAKMLNLSNIREAILFPRDRGRLVP